MLSTCSAFRGFACTLHQPSPSKPYCTRPNVQALHDSMFKAVAELLQPLDDRLAYSWTLQQLERLLAPDMQPAPLQQQQSMASWGYVDTGGAEQPGSAPSALWRSTAWWKAVLHSVIKCVDADELLGALAAHLPAAGRSVESQRAVAALLVALLTRSSKAARTALERVCGIARVSLVGRMQQYRTGRVGGKLVAVLGLLPTPLGLVVM